MDEKMTIHQVDCSPSKEGGLLVSLHLQPIGGVEQQQEPAKRGRRRRRRKMTDEQVLELARTAIDQAMENDQELDSNRRLFLGASTASRRGSKHQRRQHWPG